jgi:uncharacterized protein
MNNLFSPRVEKFDFGYFLTNDAGNFIILNHEDYNKFISNNLDSQLRQRLEDNLILITNQNKQKAIKEYRASKKQILNGPSLHIIVPTARCNQNCIYCHSPNAKVNEKGFDMTKETAKKVVDFIFQSPSKTLTIEFQGGEALLNFDIVKFIVSYAKSLAGELNKELKFTIVTNLSNMDEDKLSYLVKEKVWPCTSLDGPKELHNLNRPNSFSYLKKWIPKVQKETLNRLSAICVATKSSLNFPKQIVDSYIDFGFKRIWVQPFHALGKAKILKDKISFLAEDYVKFWQTMIEYIVDNDLPLKEVTASFLLRKVIKNENPLFVDLQSPCGAVINQLAYDYNGDIYSCDEGRMVDSDLFKVGDVDMKLSEVLKSPTACSLIGLSVNDLLHCDNCAFKPYCGVCPVLAYAENASPVSKPNSFECKVVKAQFRYLIKKYFSELSYKNKFDSWASTKDL